MNYKFLNDNFEFVGKHSDNGRTILDFKNTKDTVCPKCGNNDYTRNDGANREIKTVDSDGNLVLAHIRNDLYRCKNCGKSWVNEGIEKGLRFTDEFEQQIARLVTETSMPFEEIAKNYRISVPSIRNILISYYQKRREQSDYKLPEFLGIEPVKLGKENYLLLTDAWEMTLLDIIKPEELPFIEDKINVMEVFISDLDLVDQIKILLITLELL